jgi:abortive infection bacteriophage resistance protein
MKSYLKNLSLARNWCAHDERFFDKRVKANITSNAVHTKLGIPCSPSGQYSMGQNDIFSIVIIFKQMLPKKDFNKFVYSIKSLFDRLDKSFHTISVDDIRNTMGFPTNWMDIKNV